MKEKKEKDPRSRHLNSDKKRERERASDWPAVRTKRKKKDKGGIDKFLPIERCSARCRPGRRSMRDLASAKRERKKSRAEGGDDEGGESTRYCLEERKGKIKGRPRRSRREARELFLAKTQNPPKEETASSHRCLLEKGKKKEDTAANDAGGRKENKLGGVGHEKKEDQDCSHPREKNEVSLY